MKKIKIFILPLTTPPGGAFGPMDSPFSGAPGLGENAGLNAPGSNYASQYSQATTDLIRRAVKEMIYDAAPKQFLDLKILGMQTPEKVPSDEFYYEEMPYGRAGLVCIAGTQTSAAISASPASTYTLNIANASEIANDVSIIFPDNSKGIVAGVTVTNTTTGAGTITINAYDGISSLYTPVIGMTLGNLAPVEMDGANQISSYYTINVIERTNYVQMLSKALRIGKMMLYKYTNSGTTSNYIEMWKKRMITQFRTDLSNIYWNGQMGEVQLSLGQNSTQSGAFAKTAGGIVPIMLSAGSPNVSCTLSNAKSALQELALDTEFKNYGDVRFLYGSPRALLALSEQYKTNLTRYTPESSLAKLDLKSIDIGSTKIVFVPVKRFEDPSSFPSSWRYKLILLDQASIVPCYCWPESMGTTLSRVPNGTLLNFVDTWIDSTFSLRYSNPLGGGILTITNMQ